MADNRSPRASGRSRQSRKSRRPRLDVVRILTLAAGLLLVLTLGIGLATGRLAGLVSTLLPRDPSPTASPDDPTTAAPSPTDGSPASPTPASSPTPSVPPRPVLILSVGDIILHTSVIEGGTYDWSTGGTARAKDAPRDYSHLFEDTEALFRSADLACVNYEGTLAGPPYTSYPQFSGPDAMADAIRGAGFNLVITANNHLYDRGLDGLLRTLSVFRDRGLPVIGTRASAEEPGDVVVDLRGIRVGVAAYTFETTGGGSAMTINGTAIAAAARPLVDSFNPYDQGALEEDLSAMSDRVRSLRERGAEIVLFQLHWGEEYTTRAGSYQKAMARRLADAGVDVIVGHHPHMVQEIEILASDVTGRETLVYYSIGNYMGNMLYDTHNTRGYTEDALIAGILLDRGPDGAARVLSGGYLATFIAKDDLGVSGGPVRHRAIPLRRFLEAKRDEPGIPLTRLQASMDRIASVMVRNRLEGALPVSEWTWLPDGVGPGSLREASG